MKLCKLLQALFAMVSVLVLSAPVGRAQEKGTPSTAQVRVVITDVGQQSDRELPSLKQDEVKVKQGKTFLQVTQLIPSQGDNAALQLIILIDDTQSLILPCAPSRNVGKEGGEDAERGKERADVVHKVDAGVVGKLAEKCGADAT